MSQVFGLVVRLAWIWLCAVVTLSQKIGEQDFWGRVKALKPLAQVAAARRLWLQ